MRKEKYTKEVFSSMVKISYSYHELLKNLGLICGGSNYNTIKFYIKKFECDISHFDNKKNNKLPVKHIEKTENLLVENSSFNRTHLKSRLYKDGIKKRECELCGQGEDWNGKKMSLILNHINGVRNDNRLENLRILCPNCNATLDTHCGKNIKRVKKEKVSKRNSKETLIREQTRKVERPSLETLLKETNEIGFLATGRKYGVSDNAIRKWIKHYQKLISLGI